MRTSEALLKLPDIDIGKFLEATMDSRDAYALMTERQKMILRHAIRYGQLQVVGCFKKMSAGDFMDWRAGL